MKSEAAPRSVFIAGGTGFVGSALVEKCKQLDLEYCYLTRKSELSSCNSFVGDLLSLNLLLSAHITSANTFINCSGELSDVPKMRALHVDAAQNLLAILAQSRQSNKVLFHWIQLSSCGAYGQAAEHPSIPRYVNENTRGTPSGEYECTKAEADSLIVDFAQKHDWFKYTIIRPANVFGIGMRSTAIKRIAQMIKNRFFFYAGNKNAIANFVHVDDLVKAIVLSINQSKAYNQIFLVSNDCKLSDVIDTIAGALQVPKPGLVINEFLLRKVVILVGSWIKLPISSTQIDVMMRKTYYSNQKIINVLGWSTSASVLVQLKQYIDTVFNVKNS